MGGTGSMMARRGAGLAARRSSPGPRNGRPREISPAAVNPPRAGREGVALSIPWAIRADRPPLRPAVRAPPPQRPGSAAAAITGDARLIKEQSGASRALWCSTKRSAPRTRPTRRAAGCASRCSGCTTDYTQWSGPQRVRDLLPDEAEATAAASVRECPGLAADSGSR